MCDLFLDVVEGFVKEFELLLFDFRKCVVGFFEGGFVVFLVFVSWLELGFDWFEMFYGVYVGVEFFEFGCEGRYVFLEFIFKVIVWVFEVVVEVVKVDFDVVVVYGCFEDFVCFGVFVYVDVYGVLVFLEEDVFVGDVV